MCSASLRVCVLGGAVWLCVGPGAPDKQEIRDLLLAAVSVWCGKEARRDKAAKHEQHGERLKRGGPRPEIEKQRTGPGLSKKRGGGSGTKVSSKHCKSGVQYRLRWDLLISEEPSLSLNPQREPFRFAEGGTRKAHGHPSVIHSNKESPSSSGKAGWCGRKGDYALHVHDTSSPSRGG